MTCAQCNEKTLYDKTIARRVATASRRSKRTLASMAVLGLMFCGSAASLAPAQAAPDFAGFTTHAQAVPLRVEIYEPAIPIPSSPQLEFNFSYTKVDGASGPIGTARSSAMWPGDAVGEGLKTFGQTLGLPGALTDGGYPVQVNAQSPGDTSSASQSFFAGNTGTVNATPTMAVAKEGYGTSGDVTHGSTGDGTTKAPTNPLVGLLTGDTSGLSSLLTGSKSAGPGAPTPTGSPLGVLGALVNAGGMDSISSTTYDPNADTVVAQATARLGKISLVGGIVELDGVEVVTKVVSNIAGGAKTSQSVNIGGMSIAGTKFQYTGTGFVAAGSTTAIPGLPDAPVKALASLGISFAPGAVVTTKSGAAGSVTAEGLRINIDTAALLTRLPKLPLDQLVSKLPDLPGQASILKGLIIALGQAHPKISLVLGQSTASAQTVPAIIIGGGGGILPPPVTGSGSGGGGGVPPSTGSVPPGSNPVTSPQTNPQVTPSTPINPLAAVPGLPPLGSVPMALTLAGLVLASGLGWYIRRAGLALFGGANSCVHGLKAGIPDLRKV